MEDGEFRLDYHAQRLLLGQTLRYRQRDGEFEAKFCSRYILPHSPSTIHLAIPNSDFDSGGFGISGWVLAISKQ
jgi:hypothetical protein